MQVLLYTLVILSVSFLFVLLSLVRSFKKREYLTDDGKWTYRIFTSSPKGLHSKALLSIFGNFALRPEDMIYYTRSGDNEGKTLLSNNTYRIKGSMPHSFRWSFTPYTKEGHLIAENEQALYYSSEDQDERGEIDQKMVFPSLDKTEEVFLVMRIYRAGETLLQAPGAFNFPEITHVT